MGTFMKDLGKMTKLMAMESLLISIVPNMKVTGLMTSNMEKV
jgi:hypothetical protein